MAGKTDPFVPPELSQLLQDPVPLGAAEQAPSPVSRALDRAHDRLMGLPGVVMVGEGLDEIGDPAIIVGVRSAEQLSRLPARIEGVKVVSQVIGEVDILPANRTR
jgi:hypothetical protein